MCVCICVYVCVHKCVLKSSRFIGTGEKSELRWGLTKGEWLTFIFCVSMCACTYGSVSAGWEFWPFHVTILTNVELHCGQT